MRRVCSRDTTLDGLNNALLEVEDDDRTITATLQSHVYRHHGTATAARSRDTHSHTLSHTLIHSRACRPL